MPPAWSSYQRASVEHRLVKEMKLLDQHMPHTQGLVLLDIGIADGAYLPSYLARGFRLIGLDNNPDGLCQLNTPSAHQEQRLYPILGDANRLPFREGSVDIVFMCQLLEHLNNPMQALQESYRVLKPGGYLFVDVPWWHEMFRPLSALLLRQLQHFKGQGKPPLLLRLFFKTDDGKVRRRALTSLPLRILRIFPTFRGLDPEPFIEKYLRGQLKEENLHLHFYFPREWRRLVEGAGFEVEVVSGAWLAPPPLNRSAIFNFLFGKLENRLGDRWLASVSQILILQAVKPRVLR